MKLSIGSFDGELTIECEVATVSEGFDQLAQSKGYADWSSFSEATRWKRSDFTVWELPEERLGLFRSMLGGMVR